MKEEELELLYEITNDFWDQFSTLVTGSLQKAPPHLRDHLAMMLQENTSVYHPGIEHPAD